MNKVMDDVNGHHNYRMTKKLCLCGVWCVVCGVSVNPWREGLKATYHQIHIGHVYTKTQGLTEALKMILSLKCTLRVKWSDFAICCNGWANLFNLRAIAHYTIRFYYKSIKLFAGNITVSSRDLYLFSLGWPNHIFSAIHATNYIAS